MIFFTGDPQATSLNYALRGREQYVRGGDGKVDFSVLQFDCNEADKGDTTPYPRTTLPSVAASTYSPTDPQASPPATPRVNPPVADFSKPFNNGSEPVIVTFLSRNQIKTKDDQGPGWIDTTVYDYATNGTTDKYEQTEVRLEHAITNDDAGIGYTVLGQMKLTNTPAMYRSYSWQEDIGKNAYTNCNFTITADPGVPEILFRLNVDDDKKGDAMGRKDGEYTDDAKNKEIQEKIFVSCDKFEEEQVDDKP